MSMRRNANPIASAEPLRLGPQSNIAVSAHRCIRAAGASVVIAHVDCFGDQHRCFGTALHPGTAAAPFQMCKESLKKNPSQQQHPFAKEFWRVTPLKNQTWGISASAPCQFIGAVEITFILVPDCGCVKWRQAIPSAITGYLSATIHTSSKD